MPSVPWEEGPPPQPAAPRTGGTVAAVIIALLVFCALMAPFGWSHPRKVAAGTTPGRATPVSTPASPTAP